MEWQYFVLGIIVYQILKMLALGINHAVIERRQKRFLKLVNVTVPDHKDITFIALDTSDKRSMKRLEDQLRERFNIPDQNRPADRGGDGGLRRTPSRRRDDSAR